MTTSLPKREADGRSFLESFPRWATDAPTVLAVLGIVLYAVLRIAYSLFYNNFGLTPDDLGLSYLDLLIQSAVGTVILLMVMFVVAALVVSVYVGMFGQLRMQIQMLWNNFFRMRHAKSTGSERRPSAKQEGESVPPRWPDRPGRQQHAGSSGWERRPSAKQEGESVPPRWPDRPGRRVLAAIVAIGSLAVGVAAVALVEKVVGQQVFVLSFVVISAVGRCAWALRSSTAGSPAFVAIRKCCGFRSRILGPTWAVPGDHTTSD